MALGCTPPQAAPSLRPSHAHGALLETTDWRPQSSLASLPLTPTSHPKAWTRPKEGSSSPSARDPARAALLAYEALVWYLPRYTYSRPPAPPRLGSLLLLATSCVPLCHSTVPQSLSCLSPSPYRELLWSEAAAPETRPGSGAQETLSECGPVFLRTEVPNEAASRWLLF